MTKSATMRQLLKRKWKKNQSKRRVYEEAQYLGVFYLKPFEWSTHSTLSLYSNFRLGRVLRYTCIILFLQSFLYMNSDPILKNKMINREVVGSLAR